MNRGVLALLLAVGAVLAGLSSSPALAQASGQNCIAVDDAVVGCFDTQSHAQAAANSFRPLNSVVGILWDDQGYSGYSFTFAATNNSGCLAGATYNFYLPDYGWADRAESAQSYQGCVMQIWSGYFEGDAAVCGNCVTLGSVNNNSESVGVSPSGIGRLA